MKKIFFLGMVFVLTGNLSYSAAKITVEEDNATELGKNLVKAIEKVDVEKVIDLISKGADVNHTFNLFDTSGARGEFTPVFYSIELLRIISFKEKDYKQLHDKQMEIINLLLNALDTDIRKKLDIHILKYLIDCKREVHCKIFKPSTYGHYAFFMAQRDESYDTNNVHKIGTDKNSRFHNLIRRIIKESSFSKEEYQWALSSSIENWDLYTANILLSINIDLDLGKLEWLLKKANNMICNNRVYKEDDFDDEENENPLKTWDNGALDAIIKLLQTKLDIKKRQVDVSDAIRIVIQNFSNELCDIIAKYERF